MAYDDDELQWRPARRAARGVTAARPVGPEAGDRERHLRSEGDALWEKRDLADEAARPARDGADAR